MGYFQTPRYQQTNGSEQDCFFTPIRKFRKKTSDKIKSLNEQIMEKCKQQLLKLKL